MSNVLVYAFSVGYVEIHSLISILFNNAIQSKTNSISMSKTKELPKNHSNQTLKTKKEDYECE